MIERVSALNQATQGDKDSIKKFLKQYEDILPEKAPNKTGMDFIREYGMGFG